MDIAFPYFSIFRYSYVVLLVSAMKWYSNNYSQRTSLA